MKATHSCYKHTHTIFCTWSIQKKSLLVSRTSRLSRPSRVFFGLSILERVHHYLHFSCNCSDKIDLCHFLFSTKVTLWGSIIVTIPLKSLFRRTWQNLTGTEKARIPPWQVPQSTLWDPINAVSLVHNEYTTGYVWKFHNGSPVASSRETGPEGLSVLERPRGLFSCYKDNKGNIRFFFLNVFIILCQVSKSINGTITVPICQKSKCDRKYHSYVPEKLNKLHEQKERLAFFHMKTLNGLVNIYILTLCLALAHI